MCMQMRTCMRMHMHMMNAHDECNQRKDWKWRVPSKQRAKHRLLSASCLAEVLRPARENRIVATGGSKAVAELQSQRAQSERGIFTAVTYLVRCSYVPFSPPRRRCRENTPHSACRSASTCPRKPSGSWERGSSGVSSRSSPLVRILCHVSVVFTSRTSGGS